VFGGTDKQDNLSLTFITDKKQKKNMNQKLLWRKH